jgi:hypothetical protein
MPKYTVIGYYEDTGQRFATSVEAPDPDAAELAAAKEADSELSVCGVIEGDHPCVDTNSEVITYSEENMESLG